MLGDGTCVTVCLMLAFQSSSAKAQIAALPTSPRDVVGDVRLCRFLRFFGGDVAEAVGRYDCAWVVFFEFG